VFIYLIIYIGLTRSLKRTSFWLDIIKLGGPYSLKICLIKYSATNIIGIKSIGIIYRIFIRRLITTITFINLLLLGRLTIKLIKISCYLYIRISNG